MTSHVTPNIQRSVFGKCDIFIYIILSIAGNPCRLLEHLHGQYTTINSIRTYLKAVKRCWKQWSFKHQDAWADPEFPQLNTFALSSFRPGRQRCNPRSGRKIMPKGQLSFTAASYGTAWPMGVCSIPPRTGDQVMQSEPLLDDHLVFLIC